MKILKLSTDDVISLWETLEEMLPVDQQDKCAKEFIDKLIELKADYQFIDSIRNYNNTLDPYLEDALLELSTSNKRRSSYYDDEESENEDYDYDYDY